MSSPNVGLYSISVRGVDVPGLLTWAANTGIPFVHLRGGPRGFDLARCDAATLRRWRQHSQGTIPITGVTADLDLADLFARARPAREAARQELLRLADATAALGAEWLRLLARTPLGATAAGAVPQAAVPLLVELHHPHWLTPTQLAFLDELLHRCPHLRLLADTAQLAAAFTPARQDTRSALDRVLSHSAVLHLSDDGRGLDAPGRALVAAHAAKRMAAGHRVEVAVEWTGSPRTPEAAMARYRAALAWWDSLSGRNSARSYGVRPFTSRQQ